MQCIGQAPHTKRDKIQLLQFHKNSLLHYRLRLGRSSSARLLPKGRKNKQACCIEVLRLRTRLTLSSSVATRDSLCELCLSSRCSVTSAIHASMMALAAYSVRLARYFIKFHFTHYRLRLGRSSSARLLPARRRKETLVPKVSRTGRKNKQACCIEILRLRTRLTLSSSVATRDSLSELCLSSRCSVTSAIHASMMALAAYSVRLAR